MAEGTLIAKRDGDRLYSEGTRSELGRTIWYGYIKTLDGQRIDVPNIDVLLGHGYWDEIVD